MESSQARQSPFPVILTYLLAFALGILLWKIIPKDDDAQTSTGWDEYVQFAKNQNSLPSN